MGCSLFFFPKRGGRVILALPQNNNADEMHSSIPCGVAPTDCFETRSAVIALDRTHAHPPIRRSVYRQRLPSRIHELLLAPRKSIV
jgi:hypothetical protein